MTSWQLNFAYKLADFQLSANIAWQARVTGLVGPSGSGKSTLLELLLGLRDGKGMQGLLRCNNRDLFNSAKGIALPIAERGFAWVPQNKALFPHFTVADNIKYARPRKEHAADEFTKLVSSFGIAPFLDVYPQQLSGGEAQRVALARALYSKTNIIFLDEPLSSLDAPLKKQIHTYIESAVSGFGASLIYVTHDISELSGFADQVLEVSAGMIKKIP